MGFNNIFRHLLELPSLEKPPEIRMTEINGSALSWNHLGDGIPVLFLHPEFSDMRVWYPAVHAIAPEFRIWLLDQRGFGHSETARQPFSVEEDIIAFIDREIHEPVHLVAVSSSCHYALGSVMANAEHFLSLTLISPMLLKWNFSESFQKIKRELIKATNEGWPSTVLRLWLKNPIVERIQNVMVKSVILQLAEQNAHTFKKNGLQKLSPVIDEEVLEALNLPVQIITGNNDIADLENLANWLENHIPDTTRISIEEAGHFPYLEQREEFWQQFVKIFTSEPVPDE